MVATNNGGGGLPFGGAGVFAAKSLRLEDSTVTGNDGYAAGFDLISSRRPAGKARERSASPRLPRASATPPAGMDRRLRVTEICETGH